MAIRHSVNFAGVIFFLRMQHLYKNIIVFTAALLLITVLLEYYRKGHLQIEEPAYFFGAVVFLGIVGGYIYTWVYGDKKK
ncbi:MAG TPA: hypothetical protein PKC40_01180 [Saprospiraceae bacterium]|nr:hypothetical protein [Saprospiraceae bacterium]